MELAGPNLCDPNVRLPIAVRQKGDELSVARDGGGLLYSLKIGERLQSRAGDRISPEIFRFPKPQADCNCQQRNHSRQRQENFPS
jgi:hypothetical protein